MKKHFIGATYELTQENMNNLISQLEDAIEKIQVLESDYSSIQAELDTLKINQATNYIVTGTNEVTIPDNTSIYDEFDSKDIYLKKDDQIIGLHAIGYEGPYNYTLSDIDGTVKEIETDFQEIEKWGNEYDENYKMIGKGSFRVFDLTIEDTAKEMEADGWVRFERTPHE